MAGDAPQLCDGFPVKSHEHTQPLSVYYSAPNPIMT